MGSTAKALVVALLLGLSYGAPAASVWFSANDSVYRLDEGSSQPVLVSSLGSVQTLSVNPKDGNAWLLLGSRLLKLSESGAALGDAVWLAGEKQLVQLRLSSPGQITLTLVSARIVSGLTQDQKRGVLWVLAQDSLTGIARDGSVFRAIDLGALGLSGV